MSNISQTETRLQQRIVDEGFVFLQSSAMRALLLGIGVLTDWTAFAASWNDLPLDTYMADQGRYRRRRHAVYQCDAQSGIQRAAHQPHYQSRDYNSLNGGIARWFAPIETSIADGASMHTILTFCQRLFGGMAQQVQHWQVEAHQFRIEAHIDAPGLPTPEGVHRDGVDYVLVLLVCRQNIVSGTTTIHTAAGTQLGSFTLTAPLDAALLDDQRVYHGVTAVQPLDPAWPAHRDVLVVTLKRMIDA